MRRMEPGGARNSLSQLRRGAVEYCVLALLRDRERYGFELVRKLSEVDGLVTSEGTIYPLLTRLRRDRLVTTSWRESESGPPGATTSSPTGAARRSPASRRSGLDSATESTGCSWRREQDDQRAHKRARRRLSRRLERAAAQLPRSRRAELVAEIREHIDDALLEAGAADEVVVRNVLERLGPPEEIVAAAGPVQRRSGRLELAAMIALAIPFLGWFVGVVLVTASRAWTRREKAVAIGLVLLPAVVLALGFVAVSADGSEVTQVGATPARRAATARAASGRSSWPSSSVPSSRGRCRRCISAPACGGPRSPQGWRRLTPPELSRSGLARASPSRSRSAGRSGGSRRRSGRGRNRTGRRRRSSCRSSRSPARAPDVVEPVDEGSVHTRDRERLEERIAELAIGEPASRSATTATRSAGRAWTGQIRRRAGRRASGSRPLRERLG